MISGDDISAFNEKDPDVRPIDAEKKILNAYREVLYEPIPEHLRDLFISLALYGSMLSKTQMERVIQTAYQEYEEGQNT